MSAQKPSKESLDQRVREGVEVDFLGTAEKIVKKVQNILLMSLGGKLYDSVESLSKTDIQKIANALNVAFIEKKMGLRELASLARREITMLVIKKSTPKYRKGMAYGGIEPLEYFDRFYKENFIRGEVPANGISVVDPNLHTVLTRRGEFPEITRRLENS